MPFTIEATISESSTTRVYRAFDETLHRRVLLKVLHRHLAHDEHLRERFVREARSCAALRSEYIVQVYDLTEIDGAPAIVMEYVEGTSLKELIAGKSKRPQAFTSNLALHVLRGLRAAHGAEIIHRDIKPGNIMIAADGTAKVSDFGLARISVPSTMTTEGMLVGTPAYIAPELILGEQPDARSDLFSFGATLVEVLSGERLFEGATYGECLNRVSSFRADMLDRFIPLSSPEFIGFIKRLMNPDRRLRFASAAEALAALGDEQPSISAAQPGYVKGSWTRTSGIAAALVIAAAAIYGINSFTHRPSPQQPRSSATENTALPASDTVKKISAPLQPIAALPEESRGRRKAERSKENEGVNTASGDATNSADSGSVAITSTPWAKVYVDNTLIGETPIAAPVSLASGSHTIVFTHPSFEPVVRSITVGRGSTLRVDCNFLASAGFLNCAASPWADIYVDDIYRDTTPLDKAVVLSAGRHHVRFHNPAFQDIRQEITIAAHDTLHLSISFSR